MKARRRVWAGGKGPFRVGSRPSAPPCGYKRVNPSFSGFGRGAVHSVKEGLKVSLIEWRCVWAMWKLRDNDSPVYFG